MGIVNTLFGQNSWHLKDEDSKTLQGQFEAQNLTENISAKYSHLNGLNRAHPIAQFLGGDLESVTFDATLWNRDILFGEAQEHLEMLKGWVRRDDRLERPKILTFWVGDGLLQAMSCTLKSIGGIKYKSPTTGGKLKGVELSITLERYVGFSLDGFTGETRYHQAAAGDYYEMLTYREYGSPLMGDVIRQRNPDKLIIETGDVIKLPHKSNFRTVRVVPKSLVFKNCLSKKSTPQRDLRVSMYASRNRTKISHVFKG